MPSVAGDTVAIKEVGGLTSLTAPIMGPGASSGLNARRAVLTASLPLNMTVCARRRQRLRLEFGGMQGGKAPGRLC
jgi:hypothetical protein